MILRDPEHDVAWPVLRRDVRCTRDCIPRLREAFLRSDAPLRFAWRPCWERTTSPTAASLQWRIGTKRVESDFAGMHRGSDRLREMQKTRVRTDSRDSTPCPRSRSGNRFAHEPSTRLFRRGEPEGPTRSAAPDLLPTT